MRRSSMPIRDPEKGEKGITALIVEKRTPGFNVGKEERKLGIHAHGLRGTFFRGLRSASGKSAGRMKEKATRSRCRRSTAGASASLRRPRESLRAHLRQRFLTRQQRQAFGHPIADFQAIQFMLADMSTEIGAARLLDRRAAWKQDSGARFTMEASMAKLFASQMATRVTHRAIQIHGGYGYSHEYPVERAYRDARITEIYEGTSEIQRLVVGASVLRSY